ncbi:MAG: PorV/PorQ family protein [candidate division KSB1 bacterium]|nr:PorV/PorQ family protein [candidate division KSB1 bacterium]MDZ7318352.1 PorV/PorQ family protein [candidate division KSB1 bacterium]MDZ7340687.1 PorV/PorQ family protein [candidate division KSB1 bacterium]
MAATYLLKLSRAVIWLVMMAATVRSQVTNQMFVGARPLGLGETFVAVADDGNASYWNPAGLPMLRRMEINSMYANLYNIQGLRNAYLGLVFPNPISNRYVIGSNFFYFGYRDAELEFYRDIFSLSLGVRINRNLSLGTNLKYVFTNAYLDEFSEGRADGFGFDLGALYTLPLAPHQFLKQINFGLMIYDATGTSVRYTGTTKSDEILPQNIRFGLTLFPKDQISLKWFSLNDALLALDIDDRIHVGAETWLHENLGIRGGIQKDLYTHETPTYSIGCGLKFPQLYLQMDYAYLMPPTLFSTHLLSLSFFSSISPVKVTDLDVDDLFASFYKAYANKEIGNVTIRNDYDKELDMRLNVSIPGLTEIPTQENFTLGANEKRTFNFRAILSKNILDEREAGFRLAKIKLDYVIRNEKKSVEATKKFSLYGRGAITWDDPGKAAAFITKLDRLVELFALAATSDLPYRPELELGNIYIAAALFDAMGMIGIKYQEDPVNPFSSISRSQHAIDYIKYPAELLTQKSGDCDDLTVLYASLLEYCGIKTALLSMRRHITLMFDTGIHQRNWGILPLGDSLVVVKDKTLWVPIEVTAIGKPFLMAWREGGKRYREAENDRALEVVKVKDVEGIYPYAVPEELQTHAPESPEKALLVQMVSAETKQIDQERGPKTINRYLELISKKPNEFDLQNRLGIIYAQQDSAYRAKAHFQRVLKRFPNSVAVLINLGNVQTILGEYKSAEDSYLKAAALKPNAPGLALNLAILYQLWKYELAADSARLQEKCEQQLLQAFNLLKSDQIQALDMLGISPEEEDIGEKADFKSDLKQKASAIKRFIKVSAARHLFNQPMKDARLERRALKRGPDKDRSYILWWAESAF